MPWIDLNALREDVGIDPADHSRDGWLRRRGDAVLARMNAYVGGTLTPARKYRDIFHGHCFVNGCCEGLIPKHRPIIKVTSVTVQNNPPMDIVADVSVTTDGRIVLRQPGTSYPYYSIYPYGSEIAVEYEAGFVSLPPDLLDILVELLKQQLADLGDSGMGGQLITKMNIIDVGSVEMKPATSFAEMLGPFGAILDQYKSLSSQVGGPMAVESHDLGPGAGQDIPVASSVSPNTAAVDAMLIPLVVTGPYFEPGDLIVLDDVEEVTTFVDVQHLSTIIDPSLATAGTVAVQVRRGLVTSDVAEAPLFTFTEA